MAAFEFTYLTQKLDCSIAFSNPPHRGGDVGSYVVGRLWSSLRRACVDSLSRLQTELARTLNLYVPLRCSEVGQGGVVSR